MPVNHSIPESAMLVIDTPAGRVIHTADFKRDPPVVGEGWDDAAMAALAAEGPVKAVMCDSTSVFSPLPGRSEAGAGRADCRADQGAARHGGGDYLRLERGAAENAGRGGRGGGSHHLPSGPGDAADGDDSAGHRRSGGLSRTVNPEEAVELPRRNLMLIVTGSQGERRAASAALSRGKYLGIELKEGDTFLFFLENHSRQRTRRAEGGERPVGKRRRDRR